MKRNWMLFLVAALLCAGGCSRSGVAHVAGCDLPAREAARLGIGFENPFEERNGAIDDDFHFDSFSMFGAKVTVFG